MNNNNDVMVCSRGTTKLNTEQFRALINAQAKIKAGRFSSRCVLETVIEIHGEDIPILGPLLEKAHNLLTKRESEGGMGFRYRQGNSAFPDTYISPHYGWKKL